MYHSVLAVQKANLKGRQVLRILVWDEQGRLQSAQRQVGA